MRIVADENIVAVADYFRTHGELALLPGRAIGPADVRDADVLLVRSITQVNEALLMGSRVRFVATATSGTDHIDLDYLARANIGFASAGGSNANAVVEYCLAGMAELICQERFSLPDQVDVRGRDVGIIGFGHVGSALYRRLAALGLNCIVCDPFVEARSHQSGLYPDVAFCSLEQAMQASIVTLHTPLTRQGEHATWHLFDEARIAALAPGTLFINASRGGVVDNAALLGRLATQGDLLTLWDVWENEPDISQALLQQVDIATPHIAGYSVEAKRNASEMNYRSFLEFFGYAAAGQDAEEAASREALQVSLPASDGSPAQEQRAFAECVRAAFNIAAVDAQLRGSGSGDGANGSGAAVFDGIRRQMAGRREFSQYRLEAELSQHNVRRLSSLGFEVRTPPVAGSDQSW